MILGFIIMPVFIFFILKDWINCAINLCGTAIMVAHTHKKFFHYSSSCSGTLSARHCNFGADCCCLNLWAAAGFFKINFALPVAVFAGLMEIVPTIGPWLGGGLAVIVTLATSPHKVIWVIIGFLLIQQLEIQLIAPKIRAPKWKFTRRFC